MGHPYLFLNHVVRLHLYPSLLSPPRLDLGGRRVIGLENCAAKWKALRNIYSPERMGYRKGSV